MISSAFEAVKLLSAPIGLSESDILSGHVLPRLVRNVARRDGMVLLLYNSRPGVAIKGNSPFQM